MVSDVNFMEQAISLARSSLPFAGVNPPVGAVLVKDGVMIGHGFHRGPGTPHAEAAAIHDARTSARQCVAGATLYCSLEPCCHCGHGKRTPPCTEAIIAAGITRVVFASRDPNPMVSGKGAARLRAAGLVVEEGFMADLADPLIEAFSVSICMKRPFIRIKWAQSLDGRLACAGGSSRWITNGEARAEAHVLRSLHDAVMIGAGTLRTDDPELTVRDAPVRPELGTRRPRTVIVAGSQPLPMGARVFSASRRGRTIVVAARSSEAAAQCRLSEVTLVEVDAGRAGLPEPGQISAALYALGIGSLLLEGGSRLITAFLGQGLWDAIDVFVAPLILGQGIEVVGDLGTLSPESGIKLGNASFHGGNGFIRLKARNPQPCAQGPATSEQSIDTTGPPREGLCLQD
jgi:diaminohydroxyphosphoribosylaminopyrimidine deaminase/5-amino-6-(5-phosphoribosylamino)uracil reductase